VSKYLDIEWMGDERVEARIRKLGLDFTVVEIDPSEINVVGSRDLQTRFESRINDDHALNLAIQIESSKKVEYLVFIPGEPGFPGLLIADGNHRHETLTNDLYLSGKLAPGFKLKGYLVKTLDSYLRDLIARSFNCISDKKVLSEAHRIRHIKYLHEVHHAPVADLAQAFGLPLDTVKRELFFDMQREELRAAGVPVNNLTDAHLKEIAKIRQNDPLKQKFANVVAQYKPRVEDARLCVHQTVQALKKGGEPEAIKIIADFRKQWVDSFGAKGKGKRVPQRTALRSALGTLHTFLRRGPKGEPFATFQEMGITDQHDVHQFRQIWKESKKWMDTIIRNWGAEHEE
jgi:hypothetical protein